MTEIEVSQTSLEMFRNDTPETKASLCSISLPEEKKLKWNKLIIKTEEECLIIRSYVGVVAFIIHFLHRGYFH